MKEKATSSGPKATADPPAALPSAAPAPAPTSSRRSRFVLRSNAAAAVKTEPPSSIKITLAAPPPPPVAPPPSAPLPIPLLDVKHENLPRFRERKKQQKPLGQGEGGDATQGLQQLQEPPAAAAAPKRKRIRGPSKRERELAAEGRLVGRWWGRSGCSFVFLPCWCVKPKPP